MAGDPRELDAKVEQVKASLNGQRKRLPSWVDLTDLTSEPAPPREWLVEDMLERQTRIVLTGSEGVGKSLLAMTMAAQVAGGRPVLEAFATTLPWRVVYFDLEMARSSVRRRANALRISGQLEKGSMTFVLRPDGLDLQSPKEQRMIAENLERIKPDFIVFDPLYKVMRTDSIYERDVRPALKFFDELRVQYECGLLLVHHLRKRAHGEGSRGRDASDTFGSSVLLRWPETLLMLTEDQLSVQKDRDDVFGGIKFFPVQRGGMWPISLGTPTLVPTEEVLQAIKLIGPCSANEVARLLGGRRNDRMAAFGPLEAAGQIRKVGSGGNAKWEAVE